MNWAITWKLLVNILSDRLAIEYFHFREDQWRFCVHCIRFMHRLCDDQTSFRSSRLKIRNSWQSLSHLHSDFSQHWLMFFPDYPQYFITLMMTMVPKEFLMTVKHRQLFVRNWSLVRNGKERKLSHGTVFDIDNMSFDDKTNRKITLKSTRRHQM